MVGKRCIKCNLTKFILVIGLSVLWVACSDKEDEVRYTGLQNVTGLYLYDASGQAIGTLGNSNHKHKEGVAIYPIPATNAMFVQSQDEVIEAIYIVDATCWKESSDDDFVSASKSLAYLELEISDKSVLNINSPSSPLALNLAELERGYYRVFIKIDGEFYWYNTFIDPMVSQFANFDFFEETCQ